MDLDIEEMASFCKRKGLVYPSADIYGGVAGFFDYGPFGVEIKKKIKQSWWDRFVRQRDDIVGMDGAIVTSPKVWEASGHVDSFSDLILESEDGSYQVRADHFLEDELGGDFEGVSKQRVDELVEEHDLTAPNGEGFKPCLDFNLMFETNIGPKITDENTSYLRPETAQLIFTNFKLAKENSRQKLPFGIAQEGKAFRNEISPRNFLFRGREFEQLEIEYFVNPEERTCTFDVDDREVRIVTSSDQEEGDDGTVMSLSEAVQNDMMLDWHGYFLSETLEWFETLGMDVSNLRLRQHQEDELAHYSRDCWDIEYKYPFGWSEVVGCADRSDYDLSKHMDHSGTKLDVYDDKREKKVMPEVVAEPSLGVDRVFLALLFEAYSDGERGNVVLSLANDVVPHEVAVFPLVKKEDDVRELAKDVHEMLKSEFDSYYDERGSIGKRYARQDEIGTPYCITIDFDSLDDNAVTIRDRDSTDQIRVEIDELVDVLNERL